MSYEYTLEYKEYGGRELYYILENGEKVADFWDETYMALYIDRMRKDYQVVAVKNAKDEELLLEVLVDIMINHLDIDTSYKVCTFCSNEIDRYYGYDIKNKIYEATKEEE